MLSKPAFSVGCRCLFNLVLCLLFFLKVVVNQDKTSKQMASLRIEIQKLTMELMEFKQVHVMQLDPVIGYFKNVFQFQSYFHWVCS